MPTEFQLIQSLSEVFGQPRGHALGIGDDSALFRAAKGTRLLWTMDSIVENVHFKWDWLNAKEVGVRSGVAALSDISAMGGTPLYGLVTFSIPTSMASAKVLEVARGIQKAFRRAASQILGGNITKGSNFSIHISVLGKLEAGSAWLRSEARPGEDLYVTGTPGLSALALYLFRNEIRRGVSSILDRWKAPTPPYALIPKLRPYVSAAIDLSDGLIQDAGHLAESSDVDLVLNPLSLATPRWIQKTVEKERIRWDSLRLGPSDDYELLFTAARIHRKKVERILKKRGSRIGHVERGSGRVQKLDSAGTKVTFHDIGWDHFRK